jgi:hypothetical protein
MTGTDWHLSCTVREQEAMMREHSVTLPELALIAGTRGMFGLGLGLLISERLGSHQRRSVGWTLLIAGALSTIPLALQLFRGPLRPTRHRPTSAYDERERARAATTMME